MPDPLVAWIREVPVYHVEHHADGARTVLARDVVLLEPWVALLRQQGAHGEIVVLEERTGEIVTRVPLSTDGELDRTS